MNILQARGGNNVPPARRRYTDANQRLAQVADNF